MVPRNFSDQQLFSLRNHIPIAAVITNLLQVPAKINCGTLRFRCPLCARFNTAINDRTNLARCFDCQKNFNPIDMVMATRKINFVQAVSLLKACEHHPQTQPPGQSKRNPNTADSAPTPPASKPLQKSPQPPPNQADLFSTITEQIAELQLAIGYLSDQLNQFKVIICKLQCKP